MLILGCDFHTRYQQTAIAKEETHELLAVAVSYDQTGRYGTQTPFSDQLASDWEGGKWEVDGTHNSLVTIANGSDKIARAQLTILYNHGSGQYQIERTLAPDEQMALDFEKLIHDRVPDKNGNTLPPGSFSRATTRPSWARLTPRWGKAWQASQVYSAMENCGTILSSSLPSKIFPAPSAFCKTRKIE